MSSGLNKYSLINSLQAGSFTNSNRHINFTIAENMVVDMSQCFIQLVTRCITANSQVANLCLKNSTSVLTPKNVDLIRNCSLTGSKVGKLEDITRVNVLQSNLLELTKSTTEKASMINSLYQIRDLQNGFLLSPWVEWHKEGVDASIFRDNYLRIPLSQLFSLGSSIVDTSKTGALDVHIELENLSYVQFEEVKLFHSPTLKDEGFFQTVDTATNEITTKAFVASPLAGIKYESVEESPYFVGQQLLLDWSGKSTGPEPVIIQEIVRNVATNTITLTLNYTFSQTPPTSYAGINLTEPTSTNTGTLSIANANLGVCEVMGGKMAGDVLEYMTFTAEQYSNNSNSLERIFEVEPSAVNAFLMFNNNTSNLISRNEKVKSYRIRIDDTDVYDRDTVVNYNDGVGKVLCHDPLHYDSINRTFLNASLPLKNLTCLNQLRNDAGNSVTLEDRFKERDLQLLMLACPLPLTAGSKKVQFSVATKDVADKVENVILFKQVIKSVRLA
jgi:hypothetical protein